MKMVKSLWKKGVDNAAAWTCAVIAIGAMSLPFLNGCSGKSSHSNYRETLCDAAYAESCGGVSGKGGIRKVSSHIPFDAYFDGAPVDSDSRKNEAAEAGFRLDCLTDATLSKQDGVEKIILHIPCRKDIEFVKNGEDYTSKYSILDKLGELIETEKGFEEWKNRYPELKEYAPVKAVRMDSDGDGRQDMVFYNVNGEQVGTLFGRGETHFMSKDMCDSYDKELEATRARFSLDGIAETTVSDQYKPWEPIVLHLPFNEGGIVFFKCDDLKEFFECDGGDYIAEHIASELSEMVNEVEEPSGYLAGLRAYAPLKAVRQDADGDGRQDMVFYNIKGEPVGTLFGMGEGRFMSDAMANSYLEKIDGLNQQVAEINRKLGIE